MRPYQDELKSIAVNGQPSGSALVPGQGVQGTHPTTIRLIRAAAAFTPRKTLVVLSESPCCLPACPSLTRLLFKSQFYKDFTRPVAKVLLMAMFTYQLAYWGWVKLEQDEIRAEREGLSATY